MKRLIAIALLLASTAAIAAAQEKSTVYRLEYTVIEMDGAKKLSSHVYTLMVEDHKKGSMRVGTRVPVRTSGSGETAQYTYHDVGVNLDVTPTMVDATTIRLDMNINISSVANINETANRFPVTRQTMDQMTTLIPLDKVVTLTTQDDPSGTTSMQVQVIAKVVK